MRKIRLAVLLLISFSLFCSIFWNIFFLIYDSYFKYSHKFISSLEIPLSGNIIIIAIMFTIVLIWYIYHKKDRAESITNFLILAMYLIYLVFFVLGFFKLKNAFTIDKEIGDIWKYYSYANYVSTGVMLVISIIPLLLHFAVSVATGGYDNVSEPDNIYGFIYTTIGLCYIPMILLLGCAEKCELTDVYALNQNGLIYTFIFLTFILCAGLRFNSVVLDFLNIVMNFIFIVSWIVIICITKTNKLIYFYLYSFNLIIIIPMFVLSFYILIHYVKIDRFYKGNTKNFLND